MKTTAEIMAEDFKNNPEIAKAFHDFAMQSYQCPGCGENEIHENCECVRPAELRPEPEFDEVA